MRLLLPTSVENAGVKLIKMFYYSSLYKYFYPQGVWENKLQ